MKIQTYAAAAAVMAAAIQLTAAPQAHAQAGAAARPATAPVPVSAASTPSAPADGKGQIVFFRPSILGMGAGCDVREDGKVIGELPYRKYFVYPAAAGQHRYTVTDEDEDQITLEVEAGKTYYLSCGTAMGVLWARPNLVPSSQEEFDAVAGKLKLQKPG